MSNAVTAKKEYIADLFSSSSFTFLGGQEKVALIPQVGPNRPMPATGVRMPTFLFNLLKEKYNFERFYIKPNEVIYVANKTEETAELVASFQEAGEKYIEQYAPEKKAAEKIDPVQKFQNAIAKKGRTFAKDIFEYVAEKMAAAAKENVPSDKLQAHVETLTTVATLLSETFAEKKSAE